MSDKAAADEKKDTTAAAAPAESGTWSSAAANIRTTSTWIVSAFVATGAVIVGSGPLLGKLTGVAGWAWLFIGWGATTALLGVAVVVWAATNVMLPSYTGPGNLADRAGDTPDLRYAKEQARDALRHEEIDAVAASGLRAVAADSTHSAEIKAAATAAAAVNDASAVKWGASADSWMDLISYLRLRDRFLVARRGMFVGGGLVVVGVALYLAAVGGVPDKADSGTKPDATAAATSKTDANAAAAPSVQTLGWKDGSGDFRKAVLLDDPLCNRVTVIVHSGTGATNDPWDVQSVPDASCVKSTRFRVINTVAAVSDPTPTLAQPDPPGNAKPAEESGFLDKIKNATVGFAVIVFIVLFVIAGVAFTFGWLLPKLGIITIEEEDPDPDPDPDEPDQSGVPPLSKAPLSVGGEISEAA